MENEKNAAQSKKVTNVTLNKYIFVIALLAIPLLNWVLFWLTVNVSSIRLAFQDVRTGAFTLENFSDFWKSLTSKNGDLLIAVTNTAKYFFSGLLIVVPVSLIIAFFLYKKIFGHRAFTVIFYFPAIISSVALVKVFKEFVSPNGPLDQLFHLNIPPEGLFARSGTATKMIVIYTIWTGFTSNILLFLGAMTRIPHEVLEAARIEGCKPLRELVSIIFPLVWPTFSTMIILSFTGLFSSSGPILLFSPNGESNTTTLSFWIFKQVYGVGEVGGSGSYNLVSATGLCFTLVAMPIILTVHKLVEKVPDVEF